MNLAFWILVVISLVSLGYEIALHGEIQKKERNMYSYFVAVVICIGLYYYAAIGGFP